MSLEGLRLDTGDLSDTEVVRNVRDYLNDSSFCYYGDGVADVTSAPLLPIINARAVRLLLRPCSPWRYGALHLETHAVKQFQEKPDGDNAWINGGFFVLQPEVLDRIPDNRTSFESDVLPQLAADGRLSAYKHHGFWQPMDTLRDRTGSRTWAVMSSLEDLVILILLFGLVDVCCSPVTQFQGQLAVPLSDPAGSSSVGLCLASRRSSLVV